jgi:5-formyltetrahydrofolate cyclo-ligase
VTEKQSLRAVVGAARSAMPAGQRDAARLAIRRAVLRRCRDLGLPAGARVAAYQPLRTEPGSVELLAELHAAGYQVIVPYLLPDRDLDWLPWRPDRPGDDATQVARAPADSAGPAIAAGAPAEEQDGGGPAEEQDGGGPAEEQGGGGPAEEQAAMPPAEALGPAAIGTAAMVLVPALAVDRSGHRLGRGGGSYDRALARVPAGTVVAALLFTGELVDRVPTDSWDRPVTALASPAGWLELTGTGRGNA